MSHSENALPELSDLELTELGFSKDDVMTDSELKQFNRYNKSHLRPLIKVIALAPGEYRPLLRDMLSNVERLLELQLLINTRKHRKANSSWMKHLAFWRT